MKTSKEIEMEIERLTDEIATTEKNMIVEKEKMHDWNLTIAHLQWCLQETPYPAPTFQKEEPKYFEEPIPTKA